MRHWSNYDWIIFLTLPMAYVVARTMTVSENKHQSYKKELHFTFQKVHNNLIYFILQTNDISEICWINVFLYIELELQVA